MTAGPRRGVLVGATILVALVGLVAVWLLRPGATPTPRDPLDLDSLASYPPLAGLIPGATVTLSGAGDIAVCGADGDEATAELLDDLPGYVFTAGDNAYEAGSPDDFEQCYEPSWGRHRQRTFPAPGNHDFETAAAAGYFGYFGERAGDPRAGWYAVDLGAWRLIVLASDCALVGGCGPDSDQGRWLARELARPGATRPGACTVAIWHHPRFSTGEHGPTAAAEPFWQALHAAGVELVVNGHEHSYERFLPLDANGRPDPERGLRQFVVGTGGAALRGFPRDHSASEVRLASVHGVLRLDLRPGGYDWAFLPADGGDALDTGTGSCH